MRAIIYYRYKDKSSAGERMVPQTTHGIPIIPSVGHHVVEYGKVFVVNTIVWDFEAVDNTGITHNAIYINADELEYVENL